MSKPRMEGVPEHKAGIAARLLFRALRRRAGRLMETWPIVAHAPGILRGWALFEWHLERARSLAPRLKKLVELIAAIAQENFRARFNRPFAIESAGFSEGAFCPLPERPKS